MNEEPFRRGKPSKAAVIEDFSDILPDSKEGSSPAEKKIEELVEKAAAVKGWNNDMSQAPTNGDRVIVSENGSGEGAVCVYWRVSRCADRTTLRYVSKGRWTDTLTRQDILFKPQYWKAYNAEEFWPVRGGNS